MSNSRIEEFIEGYVVIPDMVPAEFGMTNVVRGDMTDKEWGVWNRVRNVAEIKRILRSEPPSDIPQKISEFLTEKGVASCRINQPRPII